MTPEEQVDAAILELRSHHVCTQTWTDDHPVSAVDCARLWDMGIRVDEDLYSPK